MPPWRRRRTSSIGIPSKKQFQSTPPRRRRQENYWWQKDLWYFNPRLREGGDVKALRKKIEDSDFNPRLREGGDTVILLTLTCLRISIHASEKEATAAQSRRKAWDYQFQSTPPRRRRRYPLWPKAKIGISIHASEKEATATYCDTSAIMYISSLNNFFVHYF